MFWGSGIEEISKHQKRRFPELRDKEDSSEIKTVEEKV